MKKIRKCRNLPDLGFPVQPEDLPRGTLLFDIETTGFSPAKSRLYLIGAAYLEGAALTVEQFFAESGGEEAQLLLEFARLLERFHTCISFNGLKFDLPFLKGCGKRLGINQEAVYDSRTYVDLYQISTSCRHILQLENYKQKTLEKFLKIEREDRYSGRELVKIYRKYLKTPDDTLLQLLLLHNREDVLGLAGLLPLRALGGFIEGAFEPDGWSIEKYRKPDGAWGRALSIACRPLKPLPAAFSCNNACFWLHCTPAEAVFSIPLYEGTLKYFYPDYRDYYYLPEEDTAIHKSVAAYVDKAHRRKAAAASCYTKKAGAFLPQYGKDFAPAFYKTYKDSVSYFEFPEHPDRAVLKKYCMHILHVLKSPGRSSRSPRPPHEKKGEQPFIVQ